MILRRETNIYDDEAIKNSIASVEKKFSATYGTCSTAASTVAKVVTLEDFVLFKGAQISVHFTYKNTASSPTLNVNGTGAKTIWARGAAIAATYYWSANSTHTFTYDGTHWVLDNAESQEEVFNRLTNNDTNSGLYIENGSLYLKADYIRSGKISADYIYGGKLTLGGANNVSGTLEIKNASDTVIGKWDKDGMKVSGEFSLAKPLGSFNYSMTFTTMSIPNIYSLRSEKSMGGLILESNNGNTYSDKYSKLFIGLDANVSYPKTSVYSAREIELIAGSKNAFSGVVISEGGHIGLRTGYAGGTDMIRECLSTNPAGGSLSGTWYYGSREIAVVSSSSKRYKNNITGIIDKRLDAHRLLGLQMKQFVYNDDHPTQYTDMKGQTIPGFIAEDVEEIYPSAVIHNQNGEIESWDERRIIPAMLKLIQEQHEEIAKLKQVIHVA